MQAACSHTLNWECSQWLVPHRGKRVWGRSLVTVVLNDLIFLLVSNTYFPAILTQNIKMTSIPPCSLRRGKKETENYMELTITKITARYFHLIAVFSIILSFFFVDKLPRLKSWIATLLHQKRLIFSQQVQW